MTFSFNFGRVSAGGSAPEPRDDEVCHIVLLGDFSGRSHRGERRGSDELAQLKAKRLDVDTLDAVIASFATKLRVPLLQHAGSAGSGTVEFKVQSLEDLHPDALYEQLPLFDELASLRQRLKNPATSVAAAQEARQWGAAAGVALPPADAPKAGGDSLRADAELVDFAKLLGRAQTAPAAAPPPGPLDALLRGVMAPHILQAGAPDAAALTAVVDSALSGTMRALLHHPDFQTLEAAWRSLDFMARRCEVDESLQILVYDISAEEFAADLSATDSLESTGLYKLLVERPATDARLGLPSVIVGLYGFEMTPSHAELLGRVAGIAQKAQAPFIASIGADVIGLDAATLPARTTEAWAALRKLPAARYVGLTVPRFLLRAPYGKRGEVIERFAFEEVNTTVQTGKPSPALPLVWGHSALVVAALLGQHAREEGLSEEPGSVLDMGEMESYLETDSDGDAVALRSTERPLTERQVTELQQGDWMVLVANKSRPQVRLAGFYALAGTRLAGAWTS